MKRRKTKEIYYDDVAVGGDAPISVQSMTNTRTADIEATISQIVELSEAGCEIIRVAVPDEATVDLLEKIIKEIEIPLIADIHFDYRLALGAIEQGVAGLRLNPGNIGNSKRVKEVALRAAEAGIPIRIGVNSGSVEREFLHKYAGPTAEAMVDSALKHVRFLEEIGFYDIVISLKSTSINTTIEACKLLAKEVEYPFHIGITEAGGGQNGIVKSAVGIGSLLSRGIGDTIRVSLTGNPLEEVRVGWQILKSLHLRKRGPEIISCPTCGRTEINLEKLVNKVEKAVSGLDRPLTIAVMGCMVNGPGEAREADIGIAGGRGEGLIFKKGRLLKKVSENRLLPELLKEINKL